MFGKIFKKAFREAILEYAAELQEKPRPRTVEGDVRQSPTSHVWYDNPSVVVRGNRWVVSGHGLVGTPTQLVACDDFAVDMLAPTADARVSEVFVEFVRGQLQKVSYRRAAGGDVEEALFVEE